MKNTITIDYSLVFKICAAVAALIFAWFFPSIVLYIFLSYIFALICIPLVKAIESVKIFKRSMPHSLSSLLAMIFYISLFTASIFLFIPKLVQEVRMLENINYPQLTERLNLLLGQAQDFLHDRGLIATDNTLVGIITDEIRQIATVNSFSSIMGNIAGITTSLFAATFIIIFITFFFLKDDFDMSRILKPFLTPVYIEKVNRTSSTINNLLSRYFIGTIIRLSIMIVLIYVGLVIFGIKGAFFLGFLGGILNIIPYLGPIIGCVIAVMFGIINCIGTETYDLILPVTLKIIVVFVVANLIDNIILQPVIFSKSVKAHPLEIFLVVIIGGSMAGITGMILAIPVYTIMRVVVIEIYDNINGHSPLNQ